jgi:hypothetical protein
VLYKLIPLSNCPANVVVKSIRAWGRGIASVCCGNTTLSSTTEGSESTSVLGEGGDSVVIGLCMNG